METSKKTKSASGGKASQRSSKQAENDKHENPAKRSRKPFSDKTSRERIIGTYQQHVLTEGKQPVSVYKFCLDADIAEDEFYNHFGSFEGLEREIWKGFIDKTIGRLHADRQYVEFSAREKVLAFYYTLFEVLKSNRSFILLQLRQINRFEIIPEFIKGFKKTFESYIEDELQQGKTNGEVASRPYLDKRYPQLFWLHMGFVLFFWKDDNSAAFEKTDAAIEKSLNLAFDLIGKGAVDSAIDFGKFLYQTRVG